MINLESIYVISQTQPLLYRQTYGALIRTCAYIVSQEPDDAPNHEARMAFAKRWSRERGAWSDFALWLTLSLAIHPDLSEFSADNVPDSVVLAAVEAKFDKLVEFAEIQPET